MKLGVTIPNIELGPDPEPIKALCQAVEAMGFDYLMSYDHVIGADAKSRPDWRPMRGKPPIYTIDDSFHEPLILYGYIAAVTSRIELATGVVIMPQRQTVLLAKQVAELDVLSGGRMRLGVGVGWNDVEYQALNENFENRGLRSAEQIEVLRKLWTEPCFSFEGQWHTLINVGIKPLPIQRPIPIWLGGEADPVLRRVAKLCDGWYAPSYLNEEQLAEKIALIRQYAVEYGRDPDSIGFDGIIRMWGREPEECAESLDMWQRVGATHVTFNTESDSYGRRLPGAQMEVREGRADISSMDDRIDAIRRFKGAAQARGFGSA